MTTRRIIFSRIRLDAHIGILEHERLATQPIHVDAEIDVDITQKVDDNDISTVLDYRALHDAIVQECTRGHVNLLETLTEQVAHRLLALFAETRTVKVRITKPSAFADSVGVAIEIQVNREAL
jgi:dihydroneopterin aldolase